MVGKLTVHGEEQAALCGHLRAHLVDMLRDGLQWEGTEVGRKVGHLLVVWDANRTTEGDLKITVNDNFVVQQLHAQRFGHGDDDDQWKEGGSSR